MTPQIAAQRLRAAEHALSEAESAGNRRDVAAWSIAVEVLRHFAAGPTA